MPKKPNSQSPENTRKDGVDLPEVERLLEFMAKHGLEEFEYERAGFRIRLRKPFSQTTGFSRAIAAPVDSPTPNAAHTAPTQSSREEAAEVLRSENVHVVKSPIVGTFYSAATPGSDPFVIVGARVETGQALCIIEAMKLMNEIESDVAGEVVQIFAENGQPVEYGEPLFGIRTDKKK